MQPGLELDDAAGFPASSVAEVGVNHRGVMEAQQRAGVGLEVKCVVAVARNVETAGEQQADVVVARALGQVRAIRRAAATGLSVSRSGTHG